MDDDLLAAVTDYIRNAPLKVDYVEYGALKALINVVRAVPEPANNADVFGVIMIYDAVLAALDDLPFNAAGVEARAVLKQQVENMRSIVSVSYYRRHGDTATMISELRIQSKEFSLALRQLQQRLFPFAVQ